MRSGRLQNTNKTAKSCENEHQSPKIFIYIFIYSCNVLYLHHACFEFDFLKYLLTVLKFYKS